MLYERNYNLGLTEDEEIIYEKVTGHKFNCKYNHKGFRRVVVQSELPKAARMYDTIFPNNYLDIVDLKDRENIKLLNDNFYNILNKDETTEQQILKYIKESKSYHIIGAILYGCHINTGHHGLFIFTEFQLGNSYKVDYLLVARSSGGYEFIFVEFESAYGKITKKDGNLGYEFNDGISQLEDWSRWLQSNYYSLTETFKKYKNNEKQLSDEFYNYDSSRMHYVVVAGRRSDFNDTTYRIRREKIKSNDIYILHYDNLVDYANMLLDKVTY